MHKEEVRQGGRLCYTIYHPSRKTHISPMLTEEFSKGHVRYYRDSIGGIHDADLFDKAFGLKPSEQFRPKPVTKPTRKRS